MSISGRTIPNFRPSVLVLAAIGISLLTLPLSASDSSESEIALPAPPGSLEFVGRNILGKAEGRFQEWRVVESQIDLASLETSHAVVEVELTSVDTGIESRDEHLRSRDFFDVETYPTATVRIHSARRIVSETTGRSRFGVQFDVDLHGVRATVDGEIELVEKSPPTFEGSLTLDRMVFGVGPKPGFWSPMTPKAEIPVHFRLSL